MVQEVGRIAEEIYGPITKSSGIEPREKTFIILSDVDDISNGLANPLNHTIFIWIKSYKKETTGSLQWLRRVISHEFAHVVTFWRSRNFLGKIWELLTLGTTPNWYVEGVAQYQAESWDDHRDLLLRTAVRSGALVPPRKLDGFVGSDIIDSRLVYEEGHGLIRYLASQYGKEKVRELLQKHRRFPLSFTWTMKRTLGKTTGRLFKEWQSEVEESCDPFFSVKESGEQIGEKIRLPLQAVTGIRYSKDGRMAVVGIERWDEGIQRLYIAEKDGSNLQCMSGPHVGSYFSWSLDGKNVVISRKRRGRNGSLVDDLFLVDVVSKKEKRITDNLRAADPVWSPVRNEICFVRHIQQRSSLWLLDFQKGEKRVLIDLGVDFEIYSPSWSPDGKQIAFSLIDNRGYRDIAVVGQHGMGFRKLMNDVIDDRTPVWSSDGEWIAFCSYVGGVPNLYRIRSNGSEKCRMTDVAGGIFNPVWTPEGEGISAVVFEKRDSVAVYTIPFSRVIDRKPVNYRPDWTSFEPFDKKIDLSTRRNSKKYKSSPYRSLLHLEPLVTFPFFNQDDGGVQTGIIHYAADPLNKHQILGAITARKRVDWWVEYVNAQLEPLVNFSCWGNTEDRGNLLSSSDFRLWERKTGAGIRFSLPMNFGRSLLSNHNFSLWGNAEKIQTLYPERFSELLFSLHPFSGWINTVGLGYGWIWERPDVGYGIHPSTGFSFYLSLSRSDDFWGSDLERTRFLGRFSVRQELPWKRHVAGFKIGSFFQWGEQPIQDRIRMTSPETVRGLASSRQGDRFFYWNIEYRIPLLRDLGFRIPFFYFERFAWAFWSDWGKVWGSNLQTYETGIRQSFRDTEWIVTAGGEIRSRIYLLGKFPVVVRGGYGRKLVGTKESNWYWMLGGVF